MSPMAREPDLMTGTAFEHAAEPAFVMDPRHDRVLAANDAGCALLGYTRAELVGLHVSRIHPAEMAELSALLRRVLDDGRASTIKLTCRTKSGTFLPTEISLHKLAVGGRARVLGLVQDRSEHRPGREREPMRLIIRTASPAHAGALRELHRRASSVWEEDRPFLEAHPELFGVDPAALAAGRTRVASASGEIVGFATVVPHGEDDLELEDLFVEPAAMRRGVGRALVQDAVGRGRRAGRARILVVAAPRTRAFYERLGFVIVGDAATRFGPALRLERVLDGLPDGSDAT